MSHYIYVVQNCVAPGVFLKHGTLHFLTQWVARPRHRGQCWQILLWKIK